ncbi:transposase, partial [Candidatus Bandiella numerosa]|uniref:transposase n=1 Tax=Candidatus Bandiella numerosa TaxID=2570586 RepID=UPI001F029DFD
MRHRLYGGVRGRCCNAPLYSIKNGLMEKAKKNKPLTHWQKLFNRLISKSRYKVEQGFGTLKR